MENNSLTTITMQITRIRAVEHAAHESVPHSFDMDDEYAHNAHYTHAQHTYIGSSTAQTEDSLRFEMEKGLSTVLRRRARTQHKYMPVPSLHTDCVRAPYSFLSISVSLPSSVRTHTNITDYSEHEKVNNFRLL